MQMAFDSEKLNSEVERFGREVFSEVDRRTPSMLSPEFYTEKLLDWAMKDEEFKVSLFRFVDVLPSLSDSSSVVGHVQEYFLNLKDRLPAFLNWGLIIDPTSLPAKLAARIIKRQVRSVAEKFIVGASPQDAIRALRAIRQNRMAFTIDLLGEATVSEVEALDYKQRYEALLRTLEPEVRNWPESAPIIPGHVGERSALNISVKLSALYSQVKALNAARSVEVLADRLAEILTLAQASGTFVYVDMEDSSLTDITLETFKRVASSSAFAKNDRLGIVLQAYMRRTKQDLESLLVWAKKRGTPVGVRLVKGAYWDTESILSRQRGWSVPVWEDKSSTDANYEDLTLFLLQNHNLLLPAFASHNIRSLCFAIKAAEALGVKETAYELQALYGMANPIKEVFVERGYLVREYAPIGDLITGMGYLVRRLLENTSNEGFLRSSFHENGSLENLISKPLLNPTDGGVSHMKREPREIFSNAPLLDFSVEQNRTRLSDAVTLLRTKLRKPISVNPIIQGEVVQAMATFATFVNEDKSQRFAEIGAATPAYAEDALNSLSAAFPKWRATPTADRAEVLFRAAELLEERRFELMATMVLEEGKQWPEADFDVTEAIDFCNYYALQALKLARVQIPASEIPGERNLYFYEPRGVTAVISPWNFPLSIPCGMFAASLVTGNPTLLKPAEQSSVIASQLFQCFLDAGLPPDVAAFLPGRGEEIGPVLVRSPRVATIAFTGSREVGLQIFRSAAETSNGADQVKRVIAEMGGKNAIIVDEDADLDEAIKGVVHSAFSYQGQKCSACSRVIVVRPAYERFVERLREAVKSIEVGPASNPAAFVGSVIDKEAYDRISKKIAEARKSCEVVAEAVVAPELSAQGYIVPPIAFGNIPEKHFLLTDEIFGPVLAVLRADSFENAVQIATSSEYALTGAIFSRSPRNIEYAVREFRVGNLYINRNCTGALVDRQPFGGFKMSGVGSKAGGPDYLLQFTVPRSVSENTVRRGFAPQGD